MKQLFTLLALTLTLSSYAQDPNFHIYLCFGQSNMEGQGPIQSQDKTVDERFKVFQSLDCPNLKRDKNEWYTATPPLCQCYSKLSPADYFGRTMVECLPDSITVGVINVAVGGCDIRLFDKDLYQDYDSTYLGTWFLDKIKAYNGNPYKHLLEMAKEAQKSGVIKGILLHQGETNTGNEEWPSMVDKIYTDMITDLSLNKDSVPLLAGEVMSTEGSCCSYMNTIINKLPQTIPTAHVISSGGCADMDNAHFNSEGYRELGRRYAVKMLQVKGFEFESNAELEIYAYSQDKAEEGKIQTTERLKKYIENKEYDKAINLFSKEQQNHILEIKNDEKKYDYWLSAWTLDKVTFDRYISFIEAEKAPFIFEDGEWKIDEE